MCLSHRKAIKQPFKKESSKDINPALPELMKWQIPPVILDKDIAGKNGLQISILLMSLTWDNHGMESQKHYGWRHLQDQAQPSQSHHHVLHMHTFQNTSGVVQFPEFQCFTTLQQNSFLIHNLNIYWCNFKPLVYLSQEINRGIKKRTLKQGSLNMFWKS